MKMLQYLMIFVTVVMMSAGLKVLAQDTNVNLLSNAVFSALNEKGCPEGWSSPLPCFSLDQAVKPEGCEQSLKVSVKEAGKFFGEVTQKVTVKAQTNYTFSCMVKASPGAGVLMIKLLDAKGGEGRRIATKNAGSDWEMLKVSFSSESSDAVLVMLRYTQAAGQTLWFALPKLVENK